MAFKLDFAKLGAMSQEERASQDAARRDAAIAADNKRRDEMSKKSVIVTLDDKLDVRLLANGDTMASIRGKDEKGRAVRAVYFVPDHMEDGEKEQMLRSPEKGDRLNLDGYWKQREWRNQKQVQVKSWEFQAQRFSNLDGRESEQERQGPLGQAAKARAERDSSLPPVRSQGPSDNLATSAAYARDRGGAGR